MMYEKCIKCDRLGKDCVPNLYVMSVVEIREWARKLKEEKGWSNAYLSEISGVPKGTIDSNFSKRGGKCADVNYTTFAPILCALIGCKEEMLICNSQLPDDATLEFKNQELSQKVKQLEHDTETKKAEYEKRLSYLREQLEWRRRVIKFLMTVSCILITFILIELAIDWTNSGLGFFWR